MHLLEGYIKIVHKKYLTIKNYIFNLFIPIFPYIFLKKYIKFKLYSLTYKIFLISKSILKINLPFIITLFYYIYLFISQDTMEIYLSCFLFSVTILIKLIIITDYWVRDNKFRIDFPILHSIIKYILFILLIINLIVLIIIGQKLLIFMATYLKKFFFNMNVKNKFQDLKLSLDYKWIKNKGKKPQRPEGSFSVFDLRNKKKNKKRISHLKEKLFEVQQQEQKNFSNITLKQESFSKKRNWNKSINIEDKPEFTISDQLNNVKSEFKAYDNQEKKFKKIVVDINKNKEKFFPEESESLFNEYVSVIKILKRNLKSVEKTL